jgi:hypothetical protein
MIGVHDAPRQVSTMPRDITSVGEGGFEPPQERRSRVGVKRLGPGDPSPRVAWARGDLNPHTLASTGT